MPRRREAVSVRVEAQIAALVPAYLASRRLDVAAIRLALARGDLATVERIGHDLRGTGASYGVAALGELGAALEDAALAGRRARIEELADALHDLLERVAVPSG